MCPEVGITVLQKSRIVKKKNLKKPSFTVLKRTKAITEGYVFGENSLEKDLRLANIVYQEYSKEMVWSPKAEEPARGNGLSQRKNST